MRAVVAAVTAMAREMANADHTVPAPVMVETMGIPAKPQPAVSTFSRNPSAHIDLVPAERLLDLPPPSC